MVVPSRDDDEDGSRCPLQAKPVFKSIGMKLYPHPVNKAAYCFAALLLFYFSLLAVPPAHAQRTATPALTVRGIVTANNGDTLPGVTVTRVRTQATVVSDEKGRFSIPADPGDSLSFSFIGYSTAVYAVRGEQLTVVLQAAERNTLNDVIVIGYGTTQKKNLTTAVATVNAQQLTERSTTVNVIQGLQGKVAGVSIFQNSGKPGGAPSIKIRGTGSINASNEPLYVVDGIVGADPNTIDPNIVASVDILKDAAASAIYGARGANGVVIITTKEGARGKSDITFSHTTSIGTLQRELKLLDANGALEMLKRQYAYSGKLPPNLDPSSNFARKAELFNPDGSPRYNTNWQKEATRTAISTNSSLTFSGGNDKVTNAINVSYKNQQGVMLNSFQKQINVYGNIGWNMKPWFHLQTTLNAGAYQASNVDLSTLGLNAIRETYEFLPFLPVRYADGSYSRKGDFPGAENSENPVKLLNSIKDITGNIFAQGTMIGTVHITPKLDFVTSWGGQLAAPYHNYYSGKDVFGFSETQNGIAQRTNGTAAGWTNEEYLTYTNQFGRHYLNVVGGASWYYSIATSTFAGAENFFDDFFTYNSLQTGTVIEQPGSSRVGYQLNSYYLRPSYNYDNRYLLSASLRADGASRFGDNNKYGTFYSVSGAWRISNEKFFQHLQPVINNLKLRASYGVVGNSEIGNYATLDQLASSLSVFNGIGQPAVTLANLGNKSLKWEKQHQADIGLDISLWKSRIELTADYYNKRTSDLLYRKQLPATTGYSSSWDNVGSVRNSGFEVAVTSHNIRGNRFNWSTTVNYSMNRSKVLNLNGDILSQWAGRIEEGRSIDEFYGYVRTGTWGAAEAAEAARYGRKPGDVKYLDRNQDGAINGDDQDYLGHKLPRFEMNFTNTFSYKGFSLFVDVQWMQGNKIMDFTRFIMEGDNPNVNSYRSILQAWTPEHQNTQLGALRLPSDPASTLGVDNFTVQSGSFVRIRNIGLSYQFPRAWLARLHLQRLALSVNAENYFLFTKYTGYDPEITSFDGALNQGVDVYGYPKPKTLAFNLSVTF